MKHSECLVPQLSWLENAAKAEDEIGSPQQKQQAYQPGSLLIFIFHSTLRFQMALNQRPTMDRQRVVSVLIGICKCAF